VAPTVGVDRNRVVARVLIVALFAAIVLLLLPYVTGLLGGAILYVVARPLLQRLEQRRKRRVAAVATVFVLFVILVVPGAWLLAELVGQIPDAVRSLEQSAAAQRLMTMRIGSLELGTQLKRATSDVLQWGSRQTLGALGGVVGATINLVISLFGAYYLLMSGGQLWERSRALLPFDATMSELLRRRFHRVTEAMLVGVAVTAAAQGTLVGIAFAFLGFRNALFWGAVTALVSILPMFGSALVWLPAAIVLAGQDRVGAAIGMALFGALVVSNIDNALRLVVYRRVSHIHPMVTLVGAFAGVRAFGLAGLLIGPLVLSYAIALASIYAAEHSPAGTTRTERKAFPGATPAISPTPLVVENP
jgi:predicted PurR-regulated permease PerM